MASLNVVGRDQEEGLDEAHSSQKEQGNALKKAKVGTTVGPAGAGFLDGDSGFLAET